MKLPSLTSLSVRSRRLLAGLALVAVMLALSAGWYLHKAKERSLSDQAMGDIPKEEYEQWMQELGYTD